LIRPWASGPPLFAKATTTTGFERVTPADAVAADNAGHQTYL